MIVPTQTLDKLRCASCSGMLSMGPVSILSSGDNVCGRCVPQLPSIENQPYNELAALCVFPCKYEPEGCLAKVAYPMMRQHESDCEFRTYLCPVMPTGACEWVGSKYLLMEHVRCCHPDRIVKHPVVMQHDMAMDSFNAFLLDVYGVLFLIYVKICLVTRTVSHNVRKIGQLTNNHTFKYRLNVSNEKGNVVRKGEVQSQGPFTMEDDIALCLEINLLMNLLKGFVNTNFTITIRELMKCYKCKSIKNAKQCAYVDLENDVFYCKGCYRNFHSCKYSKDGCLVKGKSEVLNHETFFCPYNTWCDDCEENIFELYMLQHLQNSNHTWMGIEHLYTTFHIVKSVKLQVNLTMSHKGESFLFIYTKEAENNANKFLIQGRPDLIKLGCTLILRNPKTKYVGYYAMLRVYNHSQFFWDVYLTQTELHLFIDESENQFEMGADIRFY